MFEYITAIADFLPVVSGNSLDFIKSAGAFDICMIGIFIFVFYRAVRRGFSGELSRVIGLVVAMATGLICFRYFGELVKTIEGVRGNEIPTKFILFFAIVIGCFFLWVCVQRLCASFLKIPVNHKLDIFLGGCLGLIKAFSLILVICCVCYMQPNRERVERLEESSWTFSKLRPLIEIFMNR
jgi:uncharacterized membrane protein required for colicin V production